MSGALDGSELLGKPAGSEKTDAPRSESHDAAQDIVNAAKKGDAKALDLALKRHYAACENEDDDDEDAEGDAGPASSRRY